MWPANRPQDLTGSRCGTLRTAPLLSSFLACLTEPLMRKGRPPSELLHGSDLGQSNRVLSVLGTVSVSGLTDSRSSELRIVKW